MSTRIQRQGVNDVMFNEDLTINCERMVSTARDKYRRLVVVVELPQAPEDDPQKR